MDGRRVAFCKLIAVREGSYSIYVFKNLETKDYVMCTRLPNWRSPDLVIGEEGYLSYVEVSAGERYYDSSTETTRTYNYSNIYFDNFIIKQDIKNSELIL